MDGNQSCTCQFASGGLLRTQWNMNDLWFHNGLGIWIANTKTPLHLTSVNDPISAAVASYYLKHSGVRQY